MNCQTIHDRILEGLDPAASPGERRALADHLEGCARCRNLIEPDLSEGAASAPPELLEGVLRQTTGSVCAAARERLCRDLDGELDELDSELVSAHADACGECGPLRSTLAALVCDLRGMRELAPDADFVSDVLGTTLHDRAVPLAARVRNAWNRLVQRPRFAWEAAYVGAMLIWLVLGSHSDVFSGAPERIRGVVSEVPRSASALGSHAWGAASEAWSSSLTRIESDLDAHSRRAGEAIVAVKGLTLDAREAVNQLISDEPEDNEQE